MGLVTHYYVIIMIMTFLTSLSVTSSHGLTQFRRVVAMVALKVGIGADVHRLRR